MTDGQEIFRKIIQFLDATHSGTVVLWPSLRALLFRAEPPLCRSSNVQCLSHLLNSLAFVFWYTLMPRLVWNFFRLSHFSLGWPYLQWWKLPDWSPPARKWCSYISPIQLCWCEALHGYVTLTKTYNFKFYFNTHHSFNFSVLNSLQAIGFARFLNSQNYSNVLQKQAQ